MFEFHSIRKAILCLLLVISLHSYSQCVDESDFFQYQDGIALPREDDTHSEQIILSPEIPFITTKYESVYVGEIFSSFDRIRVIGRVLLDQYKWFSFILITNCVLFPANNFNKL